MTLLMVYISLFLLVVCVNCESWKNHINVLAPPLNTNTVADYCKQCNDSDNCWNCYSLEQALIKTNQLKSSVYLQMQSPGRYTLHQSVELKDISSFTLIAPLSTVIDCSSGNAGISFIRSKDIHLRNIELNGCNALQYSTTFIVKGNGLSFAKFPVSLYFLSCSDLTIEHVVIRNSPGVGVVFINTIGESILLNSIIANNGHKEKHGGGIVIEYAMCVPGNLNHCVTPNQTQVSKAVFIINGTSFINNYAKSLNVFPLRNSGGDYFGFGKGGGLSIVFKGKAKNNTISLSNLNFTHNTAQYGGSLYVAYTDCAVSNIVTFEDSFVYNSKTIVSPNHFETTAEGGGAMIMYGTMGNTFIGKSLTFVNNSAQSNGGSLSVHSTITQTTSRDSPSSLFLQNVTIRGSLARIGSASYFITHYPTSVPLVTNISNSQFIDNKIHTKCLSPGMTPCSATVYTVNHHLFFTGRDNQFKNNGASGLEIHSGTVTFDKHSETIFEGNRGDYGGGILLAECSIILIDVKALVQFKNNMASRNGGGIHVSGCSAFYNSFPITGLNNCFIQFMNNDSAIDLNKAIEFDNNIADGTINAIHSDELISCINNEVVSNIQDSLQNSLLCSFSYKPSEYNCKGQITSGELYFDVTLPSENMEMFPGQTFNLTVNSYNVHSHEIITRVEICVHDGPVSLHETDELRRKCLYGETAAPIPIVLFSNHSTSPVLLSIRGLTSNNPAHKVIVPIDLISCPNHTTLNDSKCYLQVDQSNGIACANPEYCTIDNSPNADKCPLNFSLKISKVHCWNFEDNADNTSYVLSQFVGGMCPYNYRTKFCEPICNFATKNRPEPCPVNRAGRLCGKCDDNHGISVNTGDMECITCYYPKFPMWILYLAIEFIYAIILFVVIIMAKLSLNAGGTSAFIFYCQVMTMKFPGLSYPSWVLERQYDDSYKYTIARGFTVIYSITNLDFVIPFAEPFCLSEALTPIHAITLEYLPAVFLLMLTFVVYCWVLLQNNRCNIIYRLTTLMTRNYDDASTNRKFKYVPYYFESLAVVVLLCYTRIATTSVKFLHSTAYYNLKGERLGTAFFYDGTLDFFGDGHVGYAIIAILVLMVFIFLPALILIIYPIVQTFLLPNCGNSLISTKSFTVCFKDGSKKKANDYRCFAGVYLLLRIIIAFLYLEQDIETLLISQISVAIISASLFMTLRPYKNDNYNTIDGLFFVYLALLSGLSANGYYSICQKFLIHVPLVIVLMYAGYKTVRFLSTGRIRRVNDLYQWLQEHDEIDSDDEHLLDLEEDSDVEGIFNRRLLNPEGYSTTAKNHKDWRKKSVVKLLNMSK